MSVKEHLAKSLFKGLRFDGRKKDEWRRIEVETGFLSTAEGSARVKLGKTEIVAGVKLAIGQPFPDTPDEGVLMVNAEMLPLSNPEFEAGPPGVEAIEVSRVIDRGLRESRILDTKKLCVEPGEKVWMVMIDIVSINYDGNFIDAGGLAALLALRNARFPAYKDGVVDYEEKTSKKLPLKDLQPLPVTIAKIGNNLLVDPDEEEEKMMEARLTVTSLKDGSLCALQKGGQNPLTMEEIEAMINTALVKADELRKHLG